MFGYIIPDETRLSKKSNKLLNIYYCSICKNTKRIFGNIPRFYISYDILLPAIIFDNINTTTQNESSKCIVHPIKSFIIYKNSAINYAAELNVMLIYYKLLDDINDNKKLKHILYFKILKKYHKKCSYKFLDNIFKKNINTLTDYENSNDVYTLDTLSDPSSKLFGLIFENVPLKIHKNSLETRLLLYNLGYNIGKWIYLIDAADDLEDDIKNKSFNPLIHSTFNMNNNNKERKLDELYIILITLLENCYDILKKLKLDNNEILKNYMCISLKNVTMNILNK